MKKNLQKKIDALKKIIRGYTRVVVAFSGGVDSTFLSYIAQKTLGRDNTLIVTLNFLMFSPDDLENARQIAKRYSFNHIISEVTVNSEILNKNPENRCYICKRGNFKYLKKLCKKLNYNYVLDGSNLDDNPTLRPGSRAIEELDIKTPLRDAGFTKNDIRIASKNLGLINWDRPSSPCLATRFPYGTPINKDAIKQIALAEKFLRGLGFLVVRVRYHNNLARIEVPPERIKELLNPQIRDKVQKRFEELGFKYVTIDLKGYTN